MPCAQGWRRLTKQTFSLCVKPKLCLLETVLLYREVGLNTHIASGGSVNSNEQG